MTDQKQITLKGALKLVEFEFFEKEWRVKEVKTNVYGDVCGNVHGNVCGNVEGDVCGNVHGDVMSNVEGDVSNVHGDVCGSVYGDVCGNVHGDVCGIINGREWQFVETPREKLKRLIEEGALKSQLLEAIYQLEDN